MFDPHDEDTQTLQWLLSGILSFKDMDEDSEFVEFQFLGEDEEEDEL